MGPVGLAGLVAAFPLAPHSAPSFLVGTLVYTAYTACTAYTAYAAYLSCEDHRRDIIQELLTRLVLVDEARDMVVEQVPEPRQKNTDRHKNHPDADDDPCITLGTLVALASH